MDSWEKLKIRDRAQYMRITVQNGYRDIRSIREAYNKYAEGGDVINGGTLPEVEVVYNRNAMNIANKSSARFIQRLNDPNRATIKDWENPNAVATHKLGWATDDNGDAIVFPSVQEINGELHDFTDPRYGHKPWDAFDSAIENNNYLRMSPEEAQWYTTNYKKYAPEFNKYAEGGPVRVHKNKSSTAKESTILEDRVAKVIANTKEIDHRYDIPYIEDKEMKINGITISTNALDSIAKYAGKTNTPLDKAIALGFESGYGRQPYFNYGQEKVSDRAIGNMNYFKNYGAIPAHLFVRDYEYIKGGYNNGKPYYDQDPLEHSMNYLNSGRYNTKLRVRDKDTGKILNHDQLLEKLAKQLNQDSNYLLWKRQSGLKEYSGEAEKERTRKKAHETYKTQHPFKAAIKDLFGIEYADGGDIYDRETENTQQIYGGVFPPIIVKAPRKH